VRGKWLEKDRKWERGRKKEARRRTAFEGQILKVLINLDR
jgi:hypothetical protein